MISQTLCVGTLHDFTGGTGVGGSGVAVNESTESPQGADESTVVEAPWLFHGDSM